MKTVPKLLICDIDGTIVVKGGMPLPETAKALRLFHDRGIMVALASGRPLDERIINKTIEWGLGFVPDFVIGMNGAEVWFREDGRIEKSGYLDKETVKEIMEVIWPLPVNMGVYVDGYDRVLVRKEDSWTVHSRDRNHSNIIISDMEAMCENDTGKVEMHYDETDEGDIIRAIRQHPSDKWVLIKTFKEALEVMKPGVDKGRTLKSCCERLQISLDDVIACGDMENDIPMLKIAGTGICLLNGSPEAKRIADIVTKEDVAHDGLGKCLLKIAKGWDMKE